MMLTESSEELCFWDCAIDFMIEIIISKKIHQVASAWQPIEMIKVLYGDQLFSFKKVVSICVVITEHAANYKFLLWNTNWQLIDIIKSESIHESSD